ncbi:MAG: UDP-3-O-(3-hydroxymyristoyl)glucosamine N-acyltransferase [Pseudomonadota bacterium]|uniref:UDP-3-O-(3-hydroxymyristoyl)glucosamine N-acyltransferase n=1 Tax=Hyphomonas sp. BRH_c22 TaxID=1629710 RepID=UPI0005F16AE0|nr:UDP-3-O-(3-hydroxymyristoyl)glucosamine N-acyltransferase [Hyphomonas sp. BRH_c22]
MTIDPRFYAPLGALTLGKIAELTGAALHGDASVEIKGVSASANGRAGDLSFLDGDGKGDVPVSPEVSALIVNEANLKHVPDGIPYLVTHLPRHDHGLVAFSLFQPRHLVWSGNERISPDAKVHAGVILSPGAVIGPGATVGEGSVIGANAVIGPGVQIGRKCRIGANASVFCALLGDNVTLLSGARIGEAGFGVMGGPSGMEDAPHFGRVILQDHVTIGANTCIDRGVFDDTIIGERTKFDNLCQVAHNVVFGRGVVMAAFGGISGSVKIGDGTRMGGRVGIADHVRIGEGVSLAAASGVFRDIDDGGIWGGTPAKPHRQYLREVAWLQKNANPKKTS